MQPLDRIVLDAEKIPLSGTDLNRVTENKARILVYSELENYNNIDEVFGDKDSLIILYQNRENFGHWCGLFKNTNWLKPKELYFFDPYAFRIDTELDFSDFQIRRHNGEKVPHLSNLISQGGYTVISNDYRYQKFKKDVNTCGRHVGLRIRHKDFSPEEYKIWLTKNRYYNPDFWVSILTIQS
jgi:hypothetical protein